jgi:hypothetical protein
MPRSRVLAAVVVAVHAVAGPAWASDPGVARGLALGERAFGPAPCGIVTVGRGDFVDPAILAGSDPAACRILLSRRWVREMTRAMRCTLVLHEYGHLTGHPHSSDPDSVMYAEYRRADPRCVVSRAGPGRGTSGSARTGS